MSRTPPHPAPVVVPPGCVAGLVVLSVLIGLPFYPRLGPRWEAAWGDVGPVAGFVILQAVVLLPLLLAFGVRSAVGRMAARTGLVPALVLCLILLLGGWGVRTSAVFGAQPPSKAWRLVTTASTSAVLLGVAFGGWDAMRVRARRADGGGGA